MISVMSGEPLPQLGFLSFIMSFHWYKRPCPIPQLIQDKLCLFLERGNEAYLESSSDLHATGVVGIFVLQQKVIALAERVRKIRPSAFLVFPLFSWLFLAPLGSVSLLGSVS